MRTLVVGATGLVGFEVCEQLRATGREVRALVRSTSDINKRTALNKMAVDETEGDLKDPSSLARACEGIDAVISTASSTLSRQQGDSIETVDQSGQLALVDAAQRAGVKHFVFVSFRDNPAVQFPLTVAKRTVERALQWSGMPYTILQASYFMEVWLSPALGFNAANGSVRIYGDGHRPISWISYRDVARAAVAALATPEARDKVVELGGPQALSPREVVRIFEAAGAPDVATESVPESALEMQLQTASDSLQRSFAGLMLMYAKGDAIDIGFSSRLFPFQMTTVREYVTTQLARA